MTSTKQTNKKHYPKVDHDHLIDELSDGVLLLTTSAEWIAYLDFQAKFHTYSANNVMLIHLQRPDATRVAGFHTWRKLGRVPAKGTGIYIQRPNIYKEIDKVTGEERRVLKGFGWTSVFDVSDTTGDDLPEVDAVKLLDGDDVDGVYDRLLDHATTLGFTVREDNDCDGANGYCDHKIKSIVILSTNSPLQKTKTLAHEIAHAYLHDPADIDYRANRGLCELEAESTAYVVCQALGMKTADYSFGYVAGWARGDDAVAMIKKSQGRIQRTAKAILTAFETIEVDEADSEETVAA